MSPVIALSHPLARSLDIAPRRAVGNDALHVYTSRGAPPAMHVAPVALLAFCAPSYKPLEYIDSVRWENELPFRNQSHARPCERRRRTEVLYKRSFTDHECTVYIHPALYPARVRIPIVYPSTRCRFSFFFFFSRTLFGVRVLLVYHVRL